MLDSTIKLQSRSALGSKFALLFFHLHNSFFWLRNVFFSCGNFFSQRNVSFSLHFFVSGNHPHSKEPPGNMKLSDVAILFIVILRKSKWANTIMYLNSKNFSESSKSLAPLSTYVWCYVCCLCTHVTSFTQSCFTTIKLKDEVKKINGNLTQELLFVKSDWAKLISRKCLF